MSQERGFGNFDKNLTQFMCTFLLEYERPANATCLLEILFFNYGPNKTSKPNRMQDSLKVVSATFLLVCFLMSKRIFWEFFLSQKLKLIFTEFVLKWKLILYDVLLSKCHIWGNFCSWDMAQHFLSQSDCRIF